MPAISIQLVQMTGERCLRSQEWPAESARNATDHSGRVMSSRVASCNLATSSVQPTCRAARLVPVVGVAVLVPASCSVGAADLVACASIAGHCRLGGEGESALREIRNATHHSFRPIPMSLALPTHECRRSHILCTCSRSLLLDKCHRRGRTPAQSRLCTGGSSRAVCRPGRSAGRQRSAR